jgi:hypothetical protein
MFIDDVASDIRSRLSDDQIPSDSDELFRLYAVLSLSRGITVTDADVHAGWVAWASTRERDHPSLVPYAELPSDAQMIDRPHRDAIRAVARDVGGLDKALISDDSLDEAGRRDFLKLYEMMVSSSETLVARRQGVNTFFVTINVALLTAIGLVIRSGGDNRIVAAGVLAIGTAGAVFAWAWRSLINSYGQLNTGKFKVINEMEKHLPARIYSAEWEALDRGEDPKVYRSFTSREIWVPHAALAIYAIVITGSLAVVTGIWQP